MSSDMQERKIFEAGEDIIIEGQTGENMFVLEKGRVQIWKKTEGGKKILSDLGPGHIFGEMALISSEPRIATVTALEQCVCVRIPRKNLNAIIDSSPPFVQALIRVLVRYLKENKS